MGMKLELYDWNQYETSGEYQENSLMIWKSLGEGSGGIIILTPDGKFYLEEVPQYGGEPREYGEVKSVQHALGIMRGWT